MKRLFYVAILVLNVGISLGQSNTKGLQLLNKATQDFHNFMLDYTSVSYSDIISTTEMAVRELESTSDTINLCKALVLLNDLYSEPLGLVSKTVKNYNRIYDMTPDKEGEIITMARCGMIGIYLATIPDYALKLESKIKPTAVTNIKTFDGMVRFAYSLSAVYVWSGDYVKAGYSYGLLDIIEPEDVDDYTLVWYLIAKGDYALYQLNCLGNVEDAFAIFIDCFEIMKDRKLNNSLASIYLLRDFGIACQRIREFDESIEYLEFVVDIYNRLFGKSSFSNIISLEQLASSYSGLGKYEIADSLFGETIKILKKDFYVDNYSGMILYGLYAGNLSSQKKYEEACEAYSKCLEIGKSINYEESQSYANLAINLYLDNRQNEALDETVIGLDKERDHLHRIFLSLSDKGRETYWTRLGYQNIRLYTIASANPNDRRGALYDVALLSKGILMESSSHFLEMMDKSVDEDLKNEWNSYLSLLEEINDNQTSDEESNRKRIKLLEQESRLMAKVASFKDYLEGIKYTWHDVANRLEENEVAIEFIRYNEWGTGNIIYYASVLQHDGPPVNIPLKKLDEIDIQKWSFNKKYKSNSLYKVLIEPLSEYLKDKKKIYFAPVGCLNNISVENIPVPEGGFLSDKYEIHRLSSTRMINSLNQSAAFSSAFLFGGLNYNSSSEEMEYYASLKKQSRSSDGLHSWSYLPESLEEVKKIRDQLSQINPVVVSGSEGIEERFKRLSGEKINLIHIATHGYYDQEYAKKVVQSNIPVENEALKLCGLVFSGANNSDIEEEVDDGLLSAEEISRLNLIGCELVVLSACGTGLGVTTKQDESYGLIRAFKKAGCKSILMSLWDVDDRASQLFMEQFYKSLLEGYTKSESVNFARRKVREEYSNPKYWAPFVLID